MIECPIPFPKEAAQKLRAGDEVLITGTIITARDMAHKHLIENRPPELVPLLKRGAIYHCGPIVKRAGSKFTFIAAGPTTSVRLEPYQAEIIKKYKPAIIIGKGGMGEKTRKACVKYSAVYLESVGGNAAYLAKSIKFVRNVYNLDEFGIPEAIWEIDVEEFPAIVTIDTTGTNLHDAVRKTSAEAAKKLLK